MMIYPKLDSSLIIKFSFGCGVFSESIDTVVFLLPIIRTWPSPMGLVALHRLKQYLLNGSAQKCYE